MKIYTKKGDKGDTKLLYGDAVSKDSIAPEAYGSVDELVAALGLIRYEEKLLSDAKEHILRIQRELFVVGAELATSKENLPHCCNCYYVYDQTQQGLIFSSDPKTNIGASNFSKHCL